ncbi:hypothetical protein [uncultured Amphritea sp.]|uniref:hypothetical protein n=1 Tax=uncultured Amphritea sp. TaxID=981605 RepID=UPI0026064ED7|nr:hypothetical protein [uncultured Amphritea sp.]
MQLAPARYYTPTGVLNVCSGFATVSKRLKEQTRFRVLVGKQRYTSSLTGSDGLEELKNLLLADGLKLPSLFGKIEPLALPNITISESSVIAKIAQTQEIPETRLTFQYRDSYGSFNRAVKNAQTAINLHRSYRTLVNKQQNMIENSITTLRAASTECAALADRLNA